MIDMASDVLKPTEMAFISAIAALGENAFGLAIYEQACKAAETKISYGSLYPTLDRLESAGLISSKHVPDPVRGGRPRRYFELDAAGVRAHNSTLAAYKKLAQLPALNPQLG